MSYKTLLTVALGATLVLSSCTSPVTTNQPGDSSNYNIRTGPQPESPITPGPNSTYQSFTVNEQACPAGTERVVTSTGRSSCAPT